ncbi:MAG: electron transfer flavoprotein subunit beta/FixA family protein, partial [Anaerotignaceae bacterium]
CGFEATDYMSGQVGIQLAEILNYPQVTSIVAIEPKDNGIVVKQETEEGYKMVDVALPAVVTVAKPDYEPRYPTMKNKMAARKIEIPVLTSEDLGTDSSKVGENSFVKVIKNFAPAKKSAGIKIKEETNGESAIKAVEMMAEAKVF